MRFFGLFNVPLAGSVALSTWHADVARQYANVCANPRTYDANEFDSFDAAVARHMRLSAYNVEAPVIARTDQSYSEASVAEE